MSSQAWRFPADLGNVVQAGFKEVQSEASWLCVRCRLRNGSGNTEMRGKCDRLWISYDGDGRDLSASKASKVDIREQLPWAVPPLWQLTLVLWTVPWHDFPLCNGESGGWCWFTV